MIDTKELRQAVHRHAQVALSIPIKPQTLSELLDRLEAAEKDTALKEKIIDALGSALNTVASERDDLFARIERMEKQEPVAWCATDETGTVVEALGMNQSRRFDTPLGFLPGAKGEEK